MSYQPTRKLAIISVGYDHTLEFVCQTADLTQVKSNEYRLTKVCLVWSTSTSLKLLSKTDGIFIPFAI
jgi:hypothetical protein